MYNRCQRKIFQVNGLLLLMGGLAQGQEVKDIYRQADLAYSCHPPDTGNCCGAPGERECGYIINASKPLGPGCTDPDENILREGACKLDTAPVQPVTPVFASQTALTFYLVSDLHLLRDGFHFDTQASFPSVLNYLANQKRPWPSGAGIPLGDTIDKPIGILVAGDLTFNGNDNQLDAYRLLWEPNNSNRAIRYPVYPTLGNHDVENAGNGGATSSGSADSMWRYIKSRMSPLNVDNSSTGQLDVDDGQGSHNYSFDWNNVHFVMLNTWAGDQNFYDSPSSNGLTWLKNDLARAVGASQRPVVVVQHYGLESVGDGLAFTNQYASYWQQWWSLDNFNSFWNIIRDYNVIGMFTGHRHDFDMLRPEQFIDTPASFVGVKLPMLFTNDSAGNPKILDDFMIGHGGGCEDQDCTYGSAHFLAARISANYLDVAPLDWFSNNPTYEASSSFGMNLYGDQAVCRKRINNRYETISDEVSIARPPAVDCITNGCTVTGTVRNTSGTPIGGTLAIRINANYAKNFLPGHGGLTNLDFVDSCSKHYGNAYILLKSAPPADGSPVTFTANFAKAYLEGLDSLTPITYDLVRLLDLGAPTPIDVTPASIIQATTTLATAPITVNFFDARTSIFTTSVKFVSGNGPWLKANPGSYHAGKGTFTITFESTLISGLTAGSWEADITLTGANGDTVTIPVFLVAGQSLIYSAKQIDLTAFGQNLLEVTSPNNSAVQVAAVAGPDFFVNPDFFQTPAQLSFRPSIGLLPGAYKDSLTVNYFGGSDHIPVSVQMQTVIVDTVPSNLPVTVDNVRYTSPATFTWQTSSLHTVTVDSTIQLDSFKEFQFNSWSMAGTAPTASLNAPPYSAQPTRWVATFDPYYLLTLTGVSHGTLTATPAAPGNFYKAGTSVSIQATSTDVLQSFTGALTGSTNPQILSINAPANVGAVFTKVPNAAQFTFATVPVGLSIQVDGVFYATPITFQWPASLPHTVTVPGQIYAVGTQYGFQSWSDGYAFPARQFTGAASGTFQYTANLVTQYQVAITTVPSSSGLVVGAGWVTAGASRALLPAPAVGFSFVNFTGLPPGSNGNSVVVTQPLDITANFAPLKGTTLYATAGARTTPSAFLPDQRNVPITLVNSGAGAAGDVVITAIDSFVNLSGTSGDQLQVISTLPLPIGTLLPGASATTNVLLDWPVTATRVQMRVHFAANRGAYSGFTTLNLFR